VSTFVRRAASEPAILHDRAAAEAYVALVCFKHGPPRLLGVELEWIVRPAGDPARKLDAARLAEALGPYAPTTLSPESPHHPLPAGSTLTVEPGGQVEISTPPRESLVDLVATASLDAALVANLLADGGLSLVHSGADPRRTPRRLLGDPRYVALEAYLDRSCDARQAGRIMMASTAAVQVSVDAGLGWRRWRALHVLGPVLLATFANSPVLAGVRTGWASSRMAAWFGIDPRPWDGCADPVRPDGGADPARAYAGRALDADLVCVRRGNGDWRSPPGVTFADWIDGALPEPPTTADLDYHLSTLFPPVRPRGHLEVRYLDTQPAGRWPIPVTVLYALLADEATTDAAIGLAEPTAGCWHAAARYGLADPRLAAAAREVLGLACQRLATLEVPEWLREQVYRYAEDVWLEGAQQ
jgi:glutamate--cysteine ligase